MSRAILFASAAIGLIVALPALAQPAPPCAKRVELMKHLSDKYSETPSALGLSDMGGVLEVFTSNDGSTWTVTMTLPSGMTCLIATGQNWETLPKLAASGAPI
ncbi:MAG: hypothetical protein HY057_06515 [Rhodospirillales bacterium]|nr:hypothetical protein [Rhodospirillales bacterium]